MTQSPAAHESQRTFARHMLATLAYRGAKALRDAPAGFAEFKASPKTRTPAQILAHLADLLDWALTKVEGKEQWHDSPTLDWAAGSARFFASLAKLDAYFAKDAADAPLAAPVETIFQGPIADAFTHVGQIAMLRGMAGSSVKGQNYCKAEINIGRVGADQVWPAPKS